MATLKEQDFYHFDINGAKDNLNVVVNEELEIHVTKSIDGGYNVSFCKAVDQDKVGDYYDYDSDFIQGLWVSPKSLKREEE